MKLVLTDVERQAVSDSIKHWEEDIKKHFENGDSVIFWGDDSEKTEWKNTGKKVLCYTSDCPLCLLSKTGHGYTDEDCDYCLYKIKYGNSCDEDFDGDTGQKEAWAEWISNLCLETCNTMIKKLQGILE